MSPSGSLLIVDDDADLCDALAAALEADHFEVKTVTSGAAAQQVLQTARFDAVLTDLHMTPMSGLDLCRVLNEFHPDLPVVVLTAFGSLEHAVGALRAGAFDFLTKPVDNDLLSMTLARAVDHHRLLVEVKALRERRDPSVHDSALVGESSAIQKVRGLIQRLARTDSSILICGESGTGKEVVAKELHRLSRRSAAPFVGLNCTAFPENLLESQLFGHAKGAFTDARTAQRGLFLEATGGTLFLDEIGDMPRSLQPKLLRVLQERSVRPVGENKEVPFDVRVIAATHRDLESAIQQGEFREDLYYRLNVVQIDLPPLRVRGNDVLLLAQRFLELHAKTLGVSPPRLSPAAARRLLRYNWPGNVRELANCMERAVALAESDQVTAHDLPQRLLSEPGEKSRAMSLHDDEELIPLEEVERRYILHAIEACGGSRSQTAQVLGIDRKTLYRKLQRWGAVPQGAEE